MSSKKPPEPCNDRVCLFTVMDHVKGCSVAKNRFFNPLLNSAIRWARRPVNRRPMKTVWESALVLSFQFDVNELRYVAITGVLWYTMSRRFFIMQNPYETKNYSHCPACNRGHEHAPVHPKLSVWCDVCWHSMTETEKQDAVNAVLPTERGESS